LDSFSEEIRLFIAPHLREKPKISLSGNIKALDYTPFTLYLYPIANAPLYQQKEFEQTQQLKLASSKPILSIWEDLWVTKKDIISSMLLSKMNQTTSIYARETKIVKANRDISYDFLAKNHLQVPIKEKYNFGLLYQGGLVALITVSRPRDIPREGGLYRSYEIVRYCNKANCTVIGGFSKLLKHVIKALQPDDIMSYADLDWSSGAIYHKMGFKLVEATPPLCFYLNKHSLHREYNSNKNDETEYLKIYNCGNLKFLKLFK